jgi:hypothetical protein
MNYKHKDVELTYREHYPEEGVKICTLSRCRAAKTPCLFYEAQTKDVEANRYSKCNMPLCEVENSLKTLDEAFKGKNSEW